jgi:hypothetical protein
MSMFINQMLGCLIIAAGIGGAVGWLLRHVSAGRSEQLLADVTAMMHLKEQMLEKARAQLRVATSKMPAGDNEKTLSQPPSDSGQEALSPRDPSTGGDHPLVDTDRLDMQRQEMEVAGGLVEWLDVKLTEREEQHRHALHEIERQLAERDQRIRELEQIHEQLRKQVEDNETLNASASQTVEQQIDKAA